MEKSFCIEEILGDFDTKDLSPKEKELMQLVVDFAKKYNLNVAQILYGLDRIKKAILLDSLCRIQS